MVLVLSLFRVEASQILKVVLEIDLNLRLFTLGLGVWSSSDTAWKLIQNICINGGKSKGQIKGDENISPRKLSRSA